MTWFGILPHLGTEERSRGRVRPKAPGGLSEKTRTSPGNGTQVRLQPLEHVGSNLNDDLAEVLTNLDSHAAEGRRYPFAGMQRMADEFVIVM